MALDPKDAKNSYKIATQKWGAKKNNKLKRMRYGHASSQFVNWVNSMGFEKTRLGKAIHYLEEQFHIRIVAYIFLFCLFLSLLIHFEVNLVFTDYAEGEVALADIKAPFQFEFEDGFETATQKQNAENSVPPIFDLQTQEYDRLFEKLDMSFREMRGLLGSGAIPRSEVALDRYAVKFLKNKPRFEDLLEIRDIPDETFLWLTKKHFSSRYLSYLYRLLEPISHFRILSDIKPIRQSKNDKVMVRVFEGNEPKASSIEETSVPVTELYDVISARKELGHNLPFLEKIEGNDKRALLRLASILVLPNISLNIQETAVRRQAAREGVPTQIVSIKKGQVIVPEGATVQKKQMMILDKMKSLGQQKESDFESVVSALLLTGFVIVLFSFLRRFTAQRVRIEQKDLIAMGFVTVLIVIITKFLLLVTDVTIFRDMGVLVPDKFFLYLAPAAAGSMIVGLIMTRGEVVWLFTLFLGAVLGLMVDMNFPFFVITVVSGVAGARGVFNCKKRNQIYNAGIRTGLVNLFIICCFTWLTNRENFLHTISWLAPAGFISGIASSLFTLMIIPLIETIFNYTTDIHLLELSNLNHPLLKEMLLKAPGTYHHSVIVGTMAESAAEEIGANPMLSKVGAFYHDIGKIQHAEYFVENQKVGFNPHDSISPHMSKTILVAHVKDGADMGISYKLGKPIVDIILQHHGTTLISFFYNKAKENESDMSKIVEADFRYPGPKPQFKEAGLVMIADSIEAAARSLEDPTPVRLQNIVKNIIQSKFLDGQLDECNLTLKELSKIEEVYIRILLTIYHHRIDYPTRMGGVDANKDMGLLPVKER